MNWRKKKASKTSSRNHKNEVREMAALKGLNSAIKSSVECYKCHKKGQIRKDCPLNKTGKKKVSFNNKEGKGMLYRSWKHK